MSEEEPKTEKQLIRQAEKERKKKEKLEKELKKKREGVVSSSGGGGSVVTVHASQTPPVTLGCRLRHARLLPRGVSIANVVV